MRQDHLSTPVIEVASTGCICEADVQRLRRDVFRDGTLNESQADALCFLNRRCKVCCTDWRDFFSQAVSEFLIDLTPPAGRISLDKADWLIERITTNGAVTTAAGMTLLVACLESATQVPEELSDFALAEARRAILLREGPLVRNPAGRAGLNDDERANLTLRLVRALVRHGGLNVNSTAIRDLDAGWHDSGIAEPLAEVIARAA